MLSAAGDTCPVGDIYALSGEQSPSWIDSVPRIRTASQELLQAAFGKSKNDPIPQLSQAIVDQGALFFSTVGSPFECMVFHCVSRSDTGTVAELLLERMDALRRQYKGSNEQAAIEKGQVVIVGKYVLLAVGERADSMIDAAFDAIQNP